MPGTLSVFRRVPVAAASTESVRREASETYRRVPSGDQIARPGPPPVGGRRSTRRFVMSTSAALRWMPRSFAPGATIACVPSGETPSPPPPSVPSAIAAETVPRPGSIRTIRDAGRRRPRRGSVALTQACPRASMLTPAAPSSRSRRTSRPVARSRIATFPPSWTMTAREPVIAMSIGVPASLNSAIRREPTASTSSTAPLRAAHTRVPSPLTASASGVPFIRMLPAPVRVARSMTETVRPAATYPRVPSGAAATARVLPGSATAPTTALVRVSTRTAFAVPVATITTRAWAAAGARINRARESRNARTKGLTRPATCSRAVGRRSFPARAGHRRRRRS